MSRPLVLAHRGASAERPENTLAAFRRALARRADGIELDVHVTRDGVVVVFHDDDLSRLTGAAGRVGARTWRQLARLRVRGREPIPRLDQVLRLMRGRAVVQVEIKAGVPVAPVVRAVRRARAEASVVFGSFAARSLRTARRLAPGIPRFLITEARGPRAGTARTLKALGAVGVSVDHRAVTGAAWIRWFQARGWQVWAWTVNEPGRMQRLAAWGIDGLLSDDPALLRRTV